MALNIIDIDGFDLYPREGADFPSGPSVRFNGDGLLGNAEEFRFTPEAARTPGQGLDVTTGSLVSNDNVGNTQAGLLYPIPASVRGTSLIVGASVNIRQVDTHALFSLVQADGELQYGLLVNNSGYLEVRAASSSSESLRATSDTPLPVNEWNFVEWFIQTGPEVGDNDDVVIVQTIVRVNGVIVLDFMDDNPNTSIQSISGALSPVSDLCVGIAPTSSTNALRGGVYWMDNLYFGTQSGASPTGDFLGERGVSTFRFTDLEPATVGFNALSADPVVDALSSFDGTASGFQASNVGDQLIGSSTDLFGTPVGSIDAVVVVHATNKEGVGARSVDPVLNIGGTNFSNSSDSLGTGFGIRSSSPFLSNPATLTSWTQADVEGLLFGVEITA